MIFHIIGYKFRNNPDITKSKKEKELAFELYSDDKSKRVYQVSFLSNTILTKDQIFFVRKARIFLLVDLRTLLL